MTLLVDVNHPESQEDLDSNWEPAHSLVEDAISVAEIAPCLPALAVAFLPLCLQQREGPVHCRLALLSCSLNPFFCERTRLCLRAFCGKVLSLFLSLCLFFFFSLAIPQFGLLSHVSSLRLSSGHSGLVLTLSNEAQASLFSPCLMAVHVSICLGYFSSGSCGCVCNLWVLFFPPSYVAL